MRPSIAAMPRRSGLVDREVTYAQYAQAVAALARKIGEAGVAGERIAYLMRNHRQRIKIIK